MNKKELEKLFNDCGQKKRGRPRKSATEPKNNSALNEKIINMGEMSYFTSAIDQRDDIYTVQFTNLNGTPRPLLDYFTAELRKLCNRTQKERPYKPYAGYRVYEYTPDNKVFGMVQKTSIAVTVLGLRFATRVIDIMAQARNHRFEIFIEKKSPKRRKYELQQELVEYSLADRRLLRLDEKLPHYLTAETRYFGNMVYICFRCFEDIVQCVQTYDHLNIEGERYGVKIEVHRGNRYQSIGVNYLDTYCKAKQKRLRSMQAFGIWYGNRRKRQTVEEIVAQNEMCEIEKFIYEGK